MADVSDRRIKSNAGIKPYKTALVATSHFPTPAVAQATVATATMKPSLDVSSGSGSVTLGGWSLQHTDVHRNINVIAHAPTGSHITGGGFTLVYDDCKGREKTIQVSGWTADGASAVDSVLEVPKGVDKVKTLDAAVAGPTLANVVVGVGYGPKLCIGSDVQSHSKIVREYGQTTVPTLEAPEGLFTPETTLDGSTDIDVVVNYGA